MSGTDSEGRFVRTRHKRRVYDRTLATECRRVRAFVVTAATVFGLIAITFAPLPRESAQADEIGGSLWLGAQPAISLVGDGWQPIDDPETSWNASIGLDLRDGLQAKSGSDDQYYPVFESTDPPISVRGGPADAQAASLDSLIGGRPWVLGQAYVAAGVSGGVNVRRIQGSFRFDEYSCNPVCSYRYVVGGQERILLGDGSELLIRNGSYLIPNRSHVIAKTKTLTYPGDNRNGVAAVVRYTWASGQIDYITTGPRSGVGLADDVTMDTDSCGRYVVTGEGDTGSQLVFPNTSEDQAPPYVYDVEAGSATSLAELTGYALESAPERVDISRNGRTIRFTSTSATLPGGDGTTLRTWEVRSDSTGESNCGYEGLRIAALGDSYISGEGLLPGDVDYDCGTDLHGGQYWRDTSSPVRYRQLTPGPLGIRVPIRDEVGMPGTCDTVTGESPPDLGGRDYTWYENLCHRHGLAYPNRLREALGVPAEDFLFTACSGAKTSDVWPIAQYANSPTNVHGGQPQEETLEGWMAQGGAPDVVLMSIGGNDMGPPHGSTLGGAISTAGLGGIVTKCILEDCLSSDGGAWPTRLVNRVRTVVASDLDMTFSHLRSALPEEASVFVFGYPKMLSTDIDECADDPLVDTNLSEVERAWAMQILVPELNTAARDAAEANGLTFVDISDWFAGHEDCAADAWVNGYRGGDDGPLWLKANESYHPNQAGHAAIADRFLAEYRHRLLASGPFGLPQLPPPDGPATVYLDATVETTGRALGGGHLVLQGDTITIQGTGAAPNSQLTVVQNSEPVELAQMTADAEGAFSAVVSVPWDTTEGAHTLVVSGVGPDGNAATYDHQLYVSGPMSDEDGDGEVDAGDLCPFDPAVTAGDDSDGDGISDSCDPTPFGDGDDDIDSDGITNQSDNCLMVTNADQADGNSDGIGDVCEPLQTSDAVALSVGGQITYDNASSLTSGDFRVATDQYGISRVGGSGTLPGTQGGSATVTADVARFSIFPIYLGRVRVVDPSVNLSLNHLVFFTSVQPTGTNGATSTSSWYDFSSWPWKAYRMTWTIEDLA